MKESKCFWMGRITLCRMVKIPLMDELTCALKKSALARSGRTVWVKKKKLVPGTWVEKELVSSRWRKKLLCSLSMVGGGGVRREVEKEEVIDRQVLEATDKRVHKMYGIWVTFPLSNKELKHGFWFFYHHADFLLESRTFLV